MPRGGRRDGAGRPRTGRMRRLIVSLPEDTWVRLRAQADASCDSMASIIRKSLENKEEKKC